MKAEPFPVIDLSADPILPDKNKEVFPRPMQGKFVLNPSNLWLMSADDLRLWPGAKIADMISVCGRNHSTNSPLLDFLLDQNKFIPKEWDGFEVIFGTPYQSDGTETLWYRLLYKPVFRWDWAFVSEDHKVEPKHQLLIVRT